MADHNSDKQRAKNIKIPLIHRLFKKVQMLGSLTRPTKAYFRQYAAGAPRRATTQMNLFKQPASGQVAIFVLMMFSLIFMFFGMAINVGMLVHHKINLQNAADMGALAAAAEQARILNMIGWKNYELRKNFKDFIYRYWVGFNDRHAAFPDPRSRRVANLAFQGRWTEVLNTIPSYCFGDNFRTADSGGLNACEVSEIKGVPAEIATPPKALIDAVSIEPLSAVLLQTLYQKSIALTEETRGYWENYTRDNVNGAFTEVVEYQRRSEEIYNTYLNPNRADTLSEILNQAGQEIFPETAPPSWVNFANQHTGFDRNRPEGLRMDHYTSPLLEVPLDYDQLALKTVANNLNFNFTEAFREGRLTVTPVRPQNGYINIRPINPSFDVFYTTFNIRGGVMRPKRNNPIPVNRFIVGVEKDRSVKTFYALVVKSQPELPFLPGLLPWELTAVAAAQPFGSRVGPAGNSDDYTAQTPFGRVPIIRVDEEQTIDNTQLLHDLKVAGGNLESLVENRDEPILVPNEWDQRRYIFPDVSTKKERSPIHFSDQVTALPTDSYPAARGSLSTSFGPDPEGPAGGGPRAGYSMKLVPIESVLDQLEPLLQDQLRSIKH